MTLSRAEWHRERHRERTRKCTAFLANPFLFTRELFVSKHSGRLTSSKEEVDHFLHATLQYPMRDQELEHQRAFLDQTAPKVKFDLKEPSLKESAT